MAMLAPNAAMPSSESTPTTGDDNRGQKTAGKSVQVLLDDFLTYYSPSCLFVDVRTLAKYTTSDASISTCIIDPTLLEWPESVLLRPHLQRDYLLERSLVLVVLALGEISTWNEFSTQGRYDPVSNDNQQERGSDDLIAPIPGIKFFREAMVPLFAGGQFNRLLFAQVSLLASMYMAGTKQSVECCKWLHLAAKALLPLLSEYGLLSGKDGWDKQDICRLHSSELHETVSHQLKARIVLTAWCCLKFEKSVVEPYTQTKALSSVEHRMFIPWNPFTDQDRMLYDRIFHVCADRAFSCLLVLLVAQEIGRPMGK